MNTQHAHILSPPLLSPYLPLSHTYTRTEFSRGRPNLVITRQDLTTLKFAARGLEGSLKQKSPPLNWEILAIGKMVDDDGIGTPSMVSLSELEPSPCPISMVTGICRSVLRPFIFPQVPNYCVLQHKSVLFTAGNICTPSAREPTH
jgi:hypothetical protein